MYTHPRVGTHITYDLFLIPLFPFPLFIFPAAQAYVPGQPSGGELGALSKNMSLR